MAATNPLFQSKIDVCTIKKEKKADKVQATMKKQLVKTTKAKPKPLTARVFPDKMELSSTNKKNVPIDVVQFGKIQKVNKGTKQDKVAILTYEGDKKTPIWLVFLRFNTDKGYEEFLKAVDKKNNPEAAPDQEQPASSQQTQTSQSPKLSRPASVAPQQPEQPHPSKPGPRDVYRRSSSTSTDTRQSALRPTEPVTPTPQRSNSVTSSTQSLTPINQYPPQQKKQTQQPSRQRSSSSSSFSYSTAAHQQSSTKQSRLSSRQQPSQASRHQSLKKRAFSSSSSSSSSLSSSSSSSLTRSVSRGGGSKRSTAQVKNNALTKITYVEYPLTKKEVQPSQPQYPKEPSNKSSRNRNYETTYFSNTADGGFNGQKNRSQSHEPSNKNSSRSLQAPVRVFKYVPGKGLVKAERGKMFYYSSDTEMTGRGTRSRNTSTSSSSSSSSDTMFTRKQSRKLGRGKSGRHSLSSGREYNVNEVRGNNGFNFIGFQPRRRQDVGFNTVRSSSSSSSSSSDSGHSSDWQRSHTRVPNHEQKRRNQSSSSGSSITSSTEDYFAILTNKTNNAQRGFPPSTTIRRM
ncbi:unnamed protein product [Schistocephalus solidus]|uniref:DUF5734 domain-containing protein n=2 Tax=Schistocephalus solidus TaxID=70667 RepID=A0A183T1D0_SCHSO|nr:unnamed protein product [Schistocephalus solidus]